MGRGDHLLTAIRRHLFNEIDQEMKPLRVKAIFDLLNKEDRWQIVPKQSGKHG